VIHVEVSDTIRASPVKVAGAFRDYQTWRRLFAATIREVRLIGEERGVAVLEIDHVEGHYTVVADITLKRSYKVLELLLRPCVRMQIARFVINPMKEATER
jgi:hypothetical protein